MSGKLAALGILFLLVAGALPPLSGGDGRALDPTMYTVITRFSDGAPDAVKGFLAPGTNSSTTIRIPAAALVKTATVQVSGDLYDLEGSLLYDTAGDFSAGKFQNISQHNGSLLLRPFLEKANYTAGQSPAAIAIGDVNYDGHADVVVANRKGNSVGVFAQNASLGRLEKQVAYAVGQSPEGLAIGDLDRDGRQDVAVACSGLGTLDVLHQGQDGLLETGYSVNSGNGTRAVALADFDRDGRLDAVTVNSVDKTLSLFLQDQNGDLNLVAAFPTGTGPAVVAAGDINLDGRAEAVVANRDDSTIDVFVQDATARLRKGATIATGTSPVSVAIGDFNRDGRNDVAVAEQDNGTIGVFLQGANGALGPRTPHLTAGAPAWVASGDLGYDGRTDLVAVSQAMSALSVFNQRPDGTLAPAVEYPAGNAPECVAVGDLNLDGKLDIASANTGADNISVLLMRATPPGTIPGQQTVVSPNDPHGLRIGDLNSDGLNDIALAAWSGSVLSVYPQNQAGGLGQRTDYNAGNGACVDLDLADFNRDGLTDVVTTAWTEYLISLFYQNQNGALNSRITCPVGTAAAMVAAGDLNSDGMKDFVVAAHGAFAGTNMCVFLGNASGGFDGPFNYTPGRVPTGIAVGDLDSDGLDDIAVSNQYDNNVAIYYQNRDGTLQSPVYRDTGRYPIGVVIADISSDGRNDLAVVGGSANSISVFIQDRQGGLPGAAVSYSTGNGPYLLAAGDVDSDGRNDLVVSNLNAASIGVFTQKPDGTLNQQTTYNTGGGSRPAGVAVGDINGDGRNDIVSANEVSNNLGLFHQKHSSAMNGTYESPLKDMPYDVFDATVFWNITLTGNGQNATVDLTNDGGATWTRVSKGVPLAFPDPGRSLGFRVRLASGALNETPVFENLTVRYTMHSHPTDPWLDVGGLGTPIWSWAGPFGLSGQPVSVDFTQRLNATLLAGTPDAEGFVTVPFVLFSGSLGRMRLSGLVVAYDIAPGAPALLNLRDNEYVTTQTPFFQLSAWDNDTILLQFRLETSQDGFRTVRSTHNQLVSPDSWDKQGYHPGETATFQMSQFDRLASDGEYQWRAFAWDGMAWSGPSATGRFRVDTKAPAARVLPLPAYTTSLKFNLSWSGSDPEPGSGLDPVASYDIQYKDRESSPWTDWLAGTNLTSQEFPGQQGRTYYFQARARDAAGNVGAYAMGAGDARTMVDVTPPTGAVTDDGEVSGNNTRLHASVTFSDFESDVVRYDYWIGNTSGGNETYGPASTDRTDINVGGLFLRNGTRYYITVRAQNRAGLWSQNMTTDGIVVRLKLPYASVAYTGGTQMEADIELFLDSNDPNNLGMEDADLEYRVASVRNRAAVDWSSWQEAGGSDWGDPRPSSTPFVFTGEPGLAYRFRYRVRDRAGTFSDFAEPANVTRINRPPEARIVAPLKALTGAALAFSANASNDPDGDRLTFTWDFGDGRSAQGVEVRHAYRDGRKYTVTLYVDDGVANVSATQIIDLRAPPDEAGLASVYGMLAVVAVIAAAAGAYILARRRTAPPAPSPEAPPSGARGEPTVVPGSERLPPPAPPPTAEEVGLQIAAAKAEVVDLDQMGIETARTSKMLGLAESFLADGNLDMASQYARKTVKLARDQRSRKESEIDEESARRFINDTQKMLDSLDPAGTDLKPAKKLLGLSLSFMADGNYVTGMQYSKKVRKMLEEIRDRRKEPPPTREKVVKEMAAAEALAAELKRAGDDASGVEDELGTARMFLEEDDLQPALEHVLKASALGRAVKDKERPLSPQEWKEKVARVRERVEKGKNEGLRVAEPAKMLRFSESFALQGNLEVATQYVRKAEKLLDDMDARAKVDASRPGPPKGPPRCPRCSEEIEADWGVCPYCNLNLRPVEKEVRVAKPVDDDDEAARREAKIARPVEKRAAPAKCPSCGTDIEPGWKACPDCEEPLD
jgi:6-phosphogluconolactonase (cycloisomerase 2 family)